MTHDRHTKALRPGKRRMGVEVLAATRDWLCNESGAHGVPLGRVIDELVRSGEGRAERRCTDRNHYLEHVYELRGLVREMIGCDLTDPLDELNARAQAIVYEIQMPTGRKGQR